MTSYMTILEDRQYSLDDFFDMNDLIIEERYMFNKLYVIL